MTRLSWAAVGERFYENGVDRGVLFVGNNPGVAWIGLTSVSESSIGGETKSYYIDGVKYLNLSTREEFAGTIDAYIYPDEFAPCIGVSQVRPGLFFNQQPRIAFGFSYRTMIGNDTNGSDHGYKIHIVYNATAKPASRSAKSHTDTIETNDFSWEITTKPVLVSDYAPSAHIVLDSRSVNPETLGRIEDFIYGDDSRAPQLPTPLDILDIFDFFFDFVVIDNDDDTYSISGPHTMVSKKTTPGVYTLNHESITESSAGIYTIIY